MSEAAIRQKIFDIISAVPDTGIGHLYERWAVDWGKFIEFFKDSASGRILGWEITRPGVASQRLNNIENQDDHRYVVKFYMGVKDADATELLFEAKIEAIRAAFRLNITLDGECNGTSAMSKTAGDTRMFGSVLCHYAELTITATEF